MTMIKIFGQNIATVDRFTSLDNVMSNNGIMSNVKYGIVKGEAVSQRISVILSGFPLSSAFTQASGSILVFIYKMSRE